MHIRLVAGFFATAALICGSGLALPTGASATTRTGNLAVTATVTSACAVSTAAMDFGSYTSGNSNNKDVAGSIGYTGCNGITFTVELGMGSNASGAVRNMKDAASDLLAYELYKDTARTVVFGTGANAVSVTGSAGGAGTVPVQGRIPSGQSIPPGAYTDTVAITLTF